MIEQQASRRSNSLLSRAVKAGFAALALQFTGFSPPAGDVAKPAAAPRSAVSAAVPARSVLRVVAFGSSSTAGWGASSPSASYPAKLQLILSRMMPKGQTVEVLNRGIGGQDADDMVLRIQSDVVAHKPDVVIWQTGSNDPLRGVPLSRFESDTRDGIKAMRQAGAAVILMEPQWCPRLEQAAHSGDYREAIRQIGAELGVPVIRRSDMMHRWVAAGVMTPVQMLSPDGLHMSDSGYAELARDIAPMVLKAAMIEPAANTTAQIK